MALINSKYKKQAIVTWISTLVLHIRSSNTTDLSRQKIIL